MTVLSRGPARYLVVQAERLVRPQPPMGEASLPFLTPGQERSARGRLAGEVKRHWGCEALVTLQEEWSLDRDTFVLQGTFLLFWRTDSDPS